MKQSRVTYVSVGTSALYFADNNYQAVSFKIYGSNIERLFVFVVAIDGKCQNFQLNLQGIFTYHVPYPCIKTIVILHNTTNKYTCV